MAKSGLVAVTVPLWFSDDDCCDNCTTPVIKAAFILRSFVFLGSSQPLASAPQTTVQCLRMFFSMLHQVPYPVAYLDFSCLAASFLVTRKAIFSQLARFKLFSD